MIALAPSKNEVAFEVRGAGAALFSHRDKEVLLSGPAGCVAGETRFIDPTTGQTATIEQLCRDQIAPIVETAEGPRLAGIPFCKGIDDLYRVTTASGRSFLGTLDHLVFTPNGWTRVDALVAGDVLLASSLCPPVSNSASYQPTSRQDDRRSSHTHSGSTGRYPASRLGHDGQLLTGQDSDRAPVPLRGDVLSHTRDDWREGAPVPRSERIRPYQSSDRPAMRDCLVQLVESGHEGSHFYSGTEIPRGESYRFVGRSRNTRHLQLPIIEPDRHVDNTRPFLSHSGRCRYVSTDDALVRAIRQPVVLSQPYSAFSGMSQVPESFVGPLDVYSPSLLTSKSNYTAQWDTVSSIEYERTDVFYDVHVPGVEHYVAEGIWHHNTGKTVAALWKLHLAALKYPGMRAMMVRKTGTALAASALVTFQERVIGSGNFGVKFFGGSKLKPAQFEYPNGSVIVVGGMDNPDKIMSAEYDLAYTNEATELDEADWESITSRLRYGRMPYQQLFGDCNPSYPSHWLKRRCDAGKTVELPSKHEDNPRYYDGTGWTNDGIAYLDTLNKLTGHRYQRLRLGKWVAAEGLVYPGFSPEQIREVDCTGWATVLGLDLGTRNPTAILTVRYAGDRVHIESEFYQRGLGSDEIEREAVERYEKTGADWIVVDPSAAGLIVTLMQKGVTARKATNDVVVGISRVTSMLGDLTVDPSCVNTIAEFESYAYSTKQRTERDVPVKEHDHALDALRYVCMELEGKPQWSDYDSTDLADFLRDAGAA